MPAIVVSVTTEVTVVESETKTVVLVVVLSETIWVALTVVRVVRVKVSDDKL